MNRPAAITLLTVLVMAACTVAPAPSGSPRPPRSPASPSGQRPTATPIPTPAPSTIPDPTTEPSIPADLPLSATVERDGVRVTMTLEHNPMPAGEPTWITTTVLNTGRDVLNWASGGCETTLNVYGTMADFAWRPGVRQTGPAMRWKEWALDRLPEGAVNIGFLPEGLVGKAEVGEYGCGDIFIGHRLGPGERIVQRALWNGLAIRVGAPPPTGIVSLNGTLDCHWRAGQNECANDPIEVRLDAWVRGSPAAPRIHPAEAVDLALANPEFATWLFGRPFRSGADLFVKFDARGGAWHVGLLSYYPTERTRAAVIDATTGEFRGIVGPVD